MPDAYSTAVRAKAAQMPTVWKPDHRIKIAQQIVSADAQQK